MTEAQCAAVGAQLGIAGGISSMMIGIGVGLVFGGPVGALAGGLSVVVTGGGVAGAIMTCNADVNAH